jgi:hypothetical protein
VPSLLAYPRYKGVMVIRFFKVSPWIRNAVNIRDSAAMVPSSLSKKRH